MRVVTPAMIIAVDLDECTLEDGNIKLTGMASTLTCEIVLTPKDALHTAGLFLKPKIIWACVKALFSENRKPD